MGEQGGLAKGAGPDRTKGTVKSTYELASAGDALGLVSQAFFIDQLHLEQRRTERSRRPFGLLVVEAPDLFQEPQLHERVTRALHACTRDTDVRGWYQEGFALGVIFTELGAAEPAKLAETLVGKVRRAVAEALDEQDFALVGFSFFLFPDDWDKEQRPEGRQGLLYPEQPHRRGALLAKRALDILGSSAALVVGLPVFAAIAAAVKLTSKGPVLYKQERVGQYGRKFTFLKFRSMKVDNDPSAHKEYVRKLIQGAGEEAKQDKGLYKLTNDPRVTAVGRFLRRTSLDELPQFYNVLRGDMSLVGPRPPVPYEVEIYDLWHRRRLLAVRPGVTGLWQVTGRNIATFEEMVRLDLHYARKWTVWMDIKILAQTPKAMVAGV